MANCGQCGVSVGCACNLISGICTGCFNKNLANNPTETVASKKTRKVISPTKEDPPPNTEFVQILENQYISREEKLKRINNILEKARTLTDGN